MSDQQRFLTYRDLGAMTRLSRQGVIRAIERGTLPRPLSFGPFSKRFDRVEVEAAIERLREQR